MKEFGRQKAFRVVGAVSGVVLATFLGTTGCRPKDKGTDGSFVLTDKDAPVGDGAFLKGLAGHYVPDVQKVTIDTSNSHSFAAKLAAVRSATKSIDVMYYIFIDYGFEHDFSAATFVDELVAAAKRNVKVRIIVDDGTTGKYRARLQAIKAQAIREGVGDNLDIAYFRPMTLREGSQLKPVEMLAREVHAVLKTKHFDLGQLAELAKSGLDPKFVAKLAVQNMTLEEYYRLSLASAKAQPSLTALSKNGLSALLSSMNDVFGSNPRATGGFNAMLASFFSKALGAPVSDEEVQEVLDIVKRTHHKLIVVDERLAMGGGRNMWDISNLEFDHPLRPEGRKNDTDVDYFVDDPNMAKMTVDTFNEYWRCTTDPQCPAGIPFKLETGKGIPSKDGADVWADIIAPDAAAFAQRHGESRNRHHPVYDDLLQGERLPVVYVENRLYKKAGKEEPGQIVSAWAKLIDATRGGQEVLIQNAYLVLPTELLVSIVKALGRGVKFTLITNAAEICDNPVTPMLARLQVEALMAMLQETGQSDLLDYYENAAFQQMHTKVSVIGDYLMVGSVNADSRSAYLNTENAMIIGRGPNKVSWQGHGEFDSLAQAFLAMTKEKLRTHSFDPAQPTNDGRFRKLEPAVLKAANDAAAQGSNGAALKILRSQFAVSLRLGKNYTARDLPDTTKCVEGKEGSQKAGCAMRRWLYEIMFLQF